MVPAADAPRPPARLDAIERLLSAAELAARVAVFDRAAGEGPWAVIEPDRPAVRRAGIVNLYEALRFRLENAAVRLPPEDRPAGVSIARDPLPLRADGTPDRDRLRRELGEPPGRFWPPAPADAPPLAPDWIRTLAALPELSAWSGPWTRAVSLEADLGLDSLDRLAVIVGLAEALGVPVPERGGTGIFTLGDLVDAFGPRAPERVAERTARRRAVLAADPARRSALRLVERIAWPAVRTLVRPLAARRFGRRFTPRAVGLERVDWARRPLIVAQNHQSHLDPTLLACVVGPEIHREMAFLGYAGYFGRGAARLAAAVLSILPIDADAFALRGLRAAVRAVQAGRILVIYPEGERTWRGDLRPLRGGVAWLAAATGAAVVPSVVSGAYRAAPRGWPERDHPVTIAFDEPLDPPRSLEPQALHEFLAALRARLAAMLRALGENPERGDPDTWAHGPPGIRRG
ncbi:MAG: hypothetical protein Kow0062_01830 [Acidobacteriota bacterium]